MKIKLSKGLNSPLLNFKIKDTDKDKVYDVFDCKPFDPKKQDARWNKDIGMYTIDRPKKTCKHATPFCVKTCYNIKEYRAFGKPRKIRGKIVGMELKDVKNEKDWLTWSGEEWRKDLVKKSTTGPKGGVRRIPKSIKRVRLMSRGEAFSTEADIYRVIDILKNNPNSLLWIPTRGWHDPKIKLLIETKVERYNNARIMYSTDPSDILTKEYAKTLGHSTMFYGDDSLKLDPLGRKFFKCPKTWEGRKGYCAICKNGCFSHREVHVHMKQH
jgi:hypothetical protein